MRLLNTRTYILEEFFRPPVYAILSHRWGPDEVSFEEYTTGSRTTGRGYEKIIDCCKFANARGFTWIWIDTCCIDKRSSAELSEAINSMWDWYSDAIECIAYLVDVDRSSNLQSGAGVFDTRLAQPSEWFSRGWTLQELLAPRHLIFCDQGWKVIGRKREVVVSAEISRITLIPEICLTSHVALRLACVAQKLSWAATRVTTREEDQTYCLLGLLGVNMSLLYGERSKAFVRLQQEFIRQSDDESIFAWCDPTAPPQTISGILAPSVEYFLSSGGVRKKGYARSDRKPYVLTNKGLELNLPCHRLMGGVYLIPLELGGHGSQCCIAVMKRQGDAAFSRISITDLHPQAMKAQGDSDIPKEERLFMRLVGSQDDYEKAMEIIGDYFRRKRRREAIVLQSAEKMTSESTH